jgi:hypothetical protein
VHLRSHKLDAHLVAYFDTQEDLVLLAWPADATMESLSPGFAQRSQAVAVLPFFSDSVISGSEIAIFRVNLATTCSPGLSFVQSAYALGEQVPAAQHQDFASYVFPGKRCVVCTVLETACMCACMGTGLLKHAAHARMLALQTSRAL